MWLRPTSLEYGLKRASGRLGWGRDGWLEWLMLGDAVPLSSGVSGVMDRGRENVDNFPFMRGV